jgi:hypothetical protein
MADCGDGFNSSYAVARALAQPHLDVRVRSHDGDAKTLSLPRAHRTEESVPGEDPHSLSSVAL